MNIGDIAVLLAGLGAIAAVLWFFLGERATPPKVAPASQRSTFGRAELAIHGMTRAACVSRVEEAARRVTGVADAQVNLLANQGVFAYNPAQTSPQAIAAAIDLKDPRLAKIIKHSQDLPGEELFEYVDAQGSRTPSARRMSTPTFTRSPAESLPTRTSGPGPGRFWPPAPWPGRHTLHTAPRVALLTHP